MTKRIQGIGIGAGISRFSQQIIQQYGLDAVGYTFEPGTEAECFNQFERAVAEQRWVIIPLWHPQYLHFKYRIRALREPLNLLGGIDTATLVIRQAAAQRLDPALLETVKNLCIGNTAMTQLDYQIAVEKRPPAEAAQQWLANHPETIEGTAI